METFIQQHSPELDSIALDGENLTRLVATLLDRDNTPYQAHRGSMWVKGVGHVDPHCWLILGTGEIVDFRAQMWLGKDDRVPHGVFLPTHAQVYTSECLFSAVLHPVVVYALTGRRLEDYSSLAKPRF